MSIHMQQMLQHLQVQLLWLMGVCPCIDQPNPQTAVSSAWHQAYFYTLDTQLGLHISDAFEALQSAPTKFRIPQQGFIIIYRSETSMI